MLSKLLPIIGISLLTCSAAQASSFLSQTLELKDVLRLSVTEEPNANFCTLRIRGLAGHSALMIERTTVERKGRTAQVLVELTLARDGGSGNFELALNIDPPIDEVIFGSEKAIVWQRSNSKCFSHTH